MIYPRYHTNIKRSVSIFGTKKGTPETYLLTCVFSHFRPLEQPYIQLKDDVAKKLIEEFPQYKECFKYHEIPLFVNRNKEEYHWEFIPSKQYLIDYEDKFNLAFFKMSKNDRLRNGELIKDDFNPNKVAFNKNVKSDYIKAKKHNKKMKTSFNDYVEKKGVK